MLGDSRAAEIATIFLEYSPLVKSKENGGRQNSKTHTHWEKRTMTQVRFVRVSVARNLQAPGRRDLELPQIAKRQAPNATIRYFFEKHDSFAATHGFKLPMPSKPTKFPTFYYLLFLELCCRLARVVKVQHPKI